MKETRRRFLYKRCLVCWFVDWTDSWNREFHEAIEAKIQAEFQRQFPRGAEESDAMIEKMRSFYYARVTSTSTLLVAVAALIIAVLGIAVSLITAAVGVGGR
ncbi:TPA: hypothetical protein RZC51_001526 [Burkholderia cenocepacia]|nr:hypothetical protein [Burkholderia cenocepacia]